MLAVLELDAKSCPDGPRKRDLEQMVADIHHRLAVQRKAEDERAAHKDGDDKGNAEK